MRRWYLYSWGDDVGLQELPHEHFDERNDAVYVLESERLTPEEQRVIAAAKKWSSADREYADDFELMEAASALEASER
jgi:hypothetical protein